MTSAIMPRSLTLSRLERVYAVEKAHKQFVTFNSEKEIERLKNMWSVERYRESSTYRSDVDEEYRKLISKINFTDMPPFWLEEWERLEKPRLRKEAEYYAEDTSYEKIPLDVSTKRQELMEIYQQAFRKCYKKDRILIPKQGLLKRKELLRQKALEEIRAGKWVNHLQKLPSAIAAHHILPFLSLPFDSGHFREAYLSNQLLHPVVRFRLDRCLKMIHKLPRYLFDLGADSVGKELVDRANKFNIQYLHPIDYQILLAKIKKRDIETFSAPINSIDGLSLSLGKDHIVAEEFDRFQNQLAFRPYSPPHFTLIESMPKAVFKCGVKPFLDDIDLLSVHLTSWTTYQNITLSTLALNLHKAFDRTKVCAICTDDLNQLEKVTLVFCQCCKNFNHEECMMSWLTTVNGYNETRYRSCPYRCKEGEPVTTETAILVQRSAHGRSLKAMPGSFLAISR